MLQLMLASIDVSRFRIHVKTLATRRLAGASYSDMHSVDCILA